MYLLKDMLGRFYTSAGLVRISEADRSHLVKKVITDKNQVKRTVYVNPNPKQKPERPAGWESPQDKAKRYKAEREPARQKARETWKQAIDGGKVNGSELAEHLQSLTRDEIRGMLKQLNQRVGGLKKDLVNRLIAKAEENTGNISKQLDNKRNSDNNTVVNNNTTTGDGKMNHAHVKKIASHPTLLKSALKDAENALKYTLSKDSPYRSDHEKEFEDMKARYEAEEPIRDAQELIKDLLRENDIIRSKYDRNKFVKKYANGWKPVSDDYIDQLLKNELTSDEISEMQNALNLIAKAGV